MAILQVGAGLAYQHIADAVAAAKDGDVVQVQAGTYSNDFPRVVSSITLQAVGGVVNMVANIDPPNGKGIIDQYADLVVDGFAFFGAEVPDNNGAGIRSNNGSLTVRNSLFMNNQNGILAGADPAATIDIENSEFAHNGAGDGYSHNIYVGAVKQFTVNNSYFHDAVVGHEIKSRAHNTTITNSRIIDGPSATASYNIDLPNGGNATITGNTIEKGPLAQNQASIHYGGEAAPWAGSQLTISNNTIVNDRDVVIGLLNHTTITPTVTGNQLFGLTAATIGATDDSNTVLATRPTLDLTSTAPTIIPKGVPPTPLIQAVPEGLHYTTFGRDGAVHASGRVLHVGATEAFKTLQQALNASRDGDTIAVDAGTYNNDFSTARHSVIIEGVGGMAHFTADRITDNGTAIIDVQADVTIRNLDISGGQNWGGNGAGIRVIAGNFTLVNSVLHDNQDALLAANPSTTVSIFDSEIGFNGNWQKSTHNLNISNVGSFTLENSYVHDGQVAHLVNDQAAFSRIVGNRLIDGDAHDENTSFEINLGHGGDALIADNVIEKGAYSANSVSVHVGGEGAIWDNTNVQITNNTLITHLDNWGHPYTYFIVGDGGSSAGVAPPVTATGNTFVGGVMGSQQTQHATNIGSKVATTATIDTTTLPWTAPAALTPPAAATGPDTLTVQVRTLEGQTAQFLVSVDGTIIGGGTSVPGQDVTFKGDWGPGAHSITVEEVNAGSAIRGNIHAWVDKISLNDDTTTVSQELTWGAASTTLVVHAAALKLAPITQAQAGALFNPTYYLNQNPDVAASGMDPWTHFMTVGAAQGRDPSVLFSVKGYQAAHPILVATQDNALQYYLDVGKPQGEAAPAATPHATVANWLMDPAWYYKQYADVAASGIDASTHYMSGGWRLGYNPNPYFDGNWYLAQHPEIPVGTNPLYWFDAFGWKAGDDPAPNFSTKGYLAANPSVVTDNIDPLVQYLNWGKAAGFTGFAPPPLPAPPAPVVTPVPVPPAPVVSVPNNTIPAIQVGPTPVEPPAVMPIPVPPLPMVTVTPPPAAPAPSPTHGDTAPITPTSVHPAGWTEAQPWLHVTPPTVIQTEAQMFDAAYYLAHNPDVLAAHIDPLWHYENFGWSEGRDPSASFSEAKYYTAYADVKAAHIDPLWHYANYGQVEGRQAFAI